MPLQRQDRELRAGERTGLVQQDRPQYRGISQDRSTDADETRRHVHERRRDGTLVLRAEEDIGDVPGGQPHSDEVVR